MPIGHSRSRRFVTLLVFGAFFALLAAGVGGFYLFAHQGGVTPADLSAEFEVAASNGTAQIKLVSVDTATTIRVEDTSGVLATTPDGQPAKFEQPKEEVGLVLNVNLSSIDGNTLILVGVYQKENGDEVQAELERHELTSSPP